MERTQLYKCNQKCGKTRKIVINRDDRYAAQPEFPKTAGPCLCSKDGTFVEGYLVQ